MSQNYDLPQNLTLKHLRLFLPESDLPEAALGDPLDYKELIFSHVAPSLLKADDKRGTSRQKLDFSSAAGSFSAGATAWDAPADIGTKVIFVCFIDPEVDSSSSTSQTGQRGVYELRCSHFRNKCGIKRLVQTSHIGYSTFSTAKQVHAHNSAVRNEYKFKCSASQCE